MDHKKKMTTIANKLSETTFVKTDKNREQILKKYNYRCFDCNLVKNDGLDVYILDINKKPHKILPLCKSCHERTMRQQEHYDRQIMNMIVSKKNEEEYKEAKHRFRTNLRNAYDDMNTMIRILSEDNPSWSIKRIIKQILLENEDIGVSERSVYNHLDDQNRALIDPKYHHKPHQENIIIDDNNGANLHPQVIEESSIYKEIEDSENQGKKELTDEEKEAAATKILSKDIYDYATERKLSADKKFMLTNSRLQKHPKIQESLINDLVLRSNNEAKNIVAQKISDLETGYLVPSESGQSYYYGDPDKRDLIKSKVVKDPAFAFLDIVKSVHKLCEDLTGHKLERSEFNYTEDHFKYTKEYRQEIIRGNNDKRSLMVLNNQLVLIADYADDFIAMIKEALVNIDKKPNLTE